MAAGVSVIVCCYNSVLRLPETLKHLTLQKTQPGLAWEIIVVNNASTDTTAQTAQTLWDEFGSGIPLRVVNEPTPGLSHARAAGIRAAAYSVIVFCDDDNWLSPNYVQDAFLVLEENQNAGIVGGWCEGVFEIPLKPYLVPMLPALAVGKVNLNHQSEPESVYGAGMVIRKSCYEHIVRAGGDSLLSDRTGRVLVSGGDSELCFKAKMAGYALKVDDRLYFKHYIPQERLTARYFFRLCLKHVSPVIILHQYAFVFRGSRSYGEFLRSFTKDYAGRFLYFLPRMFFGKHKFYSLISFLQLIKVMFLVTVKYTYFKRYYQRILEKKMALAQGTAGNRK